MRCSLLRPKWRTTGRVWVTHRRTLLGWITRTGVVGRHSDRRGSETPGTQLPRDWSIPGADQRPATSATGSMGRKSHSNVQLDIRWTFHLRTGHKT